METKRVIVCFFGGAEFDALPPRTRRDYEAVKQAVLADGGFSTFDASSTPALAHIFDRLEADPSIRRDAERSRFPWVAIEAVAS